MEFLPIIYLMYMFIALYFLIFYLLVYLRNRKTLFETPKIKKMFSVSVIIPAYNEEGTIGDTIKAVLKTDYKGVKEIIVVNDGSTDRTADIVKELMKKNKKIKLINKKNSGKADSINRGIEIAKSELIAVVDADSYPEKDSVRKLAGFFIDDKVGAATCPVIARNRNKFLERLQAIEYGVIALTRKLLECVDAIYVTPGPLALYRKSALLEIGGFDKNNFTEDIEATWHLTYAGYKRKMCFTTRVTTTVPTRFKDWFRQRKRWNIGGIQTINKYKQHFLKKGMLGFFILPFFVISTFLGLLGLGVFVYVLSRRIISTSLSTGYSIEVGTSLLSLEDFYITPSVLNYLGVVLFIFSAIFTLLMLGLIKERILGGRNFFNILFYMVTYLSCYPFIMLSAIYSILKKDLKW